MNLVNSLEGFYNNHKAFCIVACIFTGGLPLIGYLGLRVVAYACFPSDQERRVNSVFKSLLEEEEVKDCLSDENIPAQFRVVLNEKDYHAGNLILTILTQDKPQDGFNRQEIENSQLSLLADYMGVDSESFINIWHEVDHDTVTLKRTAIAQQKWNDNLHINFNDILAEVNSSNDVSTNMRYRKLYDLLANSQILNGKDLREKFLSFFRTQEVWKNFEKTKQNWII